MIGEIISELKERLARGPVKIGQIVCEPDFSIHHEAITNETSCTVSTDPYEADEIAKYDDAGNYRALKTAPNLRRGWRLELASVEEVRMAIDFFYPLALPSILAFGKNRLPVACLREVLARQTGMYAVTKKITDDEADTVIQKLCNAESGCLRHILWRISPDRPTPLTEDSQDIPAKTPEIPLLCPEACCLIVAEARAVVKGRPTLGESSADGQN